MIECLVCDCDEDIFPGKGRDVNTVTHIACHHDIGYDFCVVCGISFSNRRRFPQFRGVDSAAKHWSKIADHCLSHGEAYFSAVILEAMGGRCV